MNLKLAFRKRVCFLLLLAVLLIVILRLSIHRSMQPTETWVAYTLRAQAFRKSVTSNIRTILLWTPFFTQTDYIKPMAEIGCPELQCRVTSNRSNLDLADAVMFHVRDTLVNDLPRYRFPWQRWVLLHHESPHHTPDFLKSLDGRINWTVTYRLDSDIKLSPSVKKHDPALPSVTKDFASNKTRLVVWFVSNCQTPSNRETFVKELQKTVHVDIIGSCGTKECVPKMSDKCYEDAAKEYRFYLSFENSLCKDYVTEKFFHILNYDIVPVVFGGADYAKMAPPKSYINALDFESPRALGKYLLEVAKDSQQYNEFFKWKSKYYLSLGGHYACQLCQKLHDNQEPIKVWNSLHRWWFEEANCRKWTNGPGNQKYWKLP